jgi:hypothetical protein
MISFQEFWDILCARAMLEHNLTPEQFKAELKANRVLLSIRLILTGEIANDRAPNLSNLSNNPRLSD